MGAFRGRREHWILERTSIADVASVNDAIQGAILSELSETGNGILSLRISTHVANDSYTQQKS
jgi:hypothetical protein